MTEAPQKAWTELEWLWWSYLPAQYWSLLQAQRGPGRWHSLGLRSLLPACSFGQLSQYHLCMLWGKYYCYQYIIFYKMSSSDWVFFYPTLASDGEHCGPLNGSWWIVAIPRTCNVSIHLTAQGMKKPEHFQRLHRMHISSHHKSSVLFHPEESGLVKRPRNFPCFAESGRH